MLNYLLIFGAEYLIFFIVAVALIYFLRQPRKIQKQILFFGIIVLPSAYLLAKIAGLIYFNPRPFVEGNFVPLVSHVADNGFPSDHTLISATIAAIIYPFNKKISALLWLLALVVGLSRVYVGVHRPIDILASLIIVITITVLIYQIIKNPKYYGSSRRNQKKD